MSGRDLVALWVAGKQLRVPFAEVVEMARAGEFGEIVEGIGRAGEPALFVSRERVAARVDAEGLEWEDETAMIEAPVRPQTAAKNRWIVED